ncbi:hypothetical protein KP509_15G066100 [Ceratopteris richardii]|uniref:Uncharacterized protein n=1 Tax=Ceratopteris richardii TaxID=49495 RepID=A0A8T2TAP2_CERRI|nr:hypothetical protein KP509_15G066100 [Ceratopteris richardii]
MVRSFTGHGDLPLSYEDSAAENRIIITEHEDTCLNVCSVEDACGQVSSLKLQRAQRNAHSRPSTGKEMSVLLRLAGKQDDLVQTNTPQHRRQGGKEMNVLLRLAGKEDDLAQENTPQHRRPRGKEMSVLLRLAGKQDEPVQTGTSRHRRRRRKEFNAVPRLDGNQDDLVQTGTHHLPPRGKEMASLLRLAASQKMKWKTSVVRQMAIPSGHGDGGKSLVQTETHHLPPRGKEMATLLRLAGSQKQKRKTSVVRQMAIPSGHALSELYRRSSDPNRPCRRPITRSLTVRFTRSGAKYSGGKMSYHEPTSMLSTTAPARRPGSNSICRSSTLNKSSRRLVETVASKQKSQTIENRSSGHDADPNYSEREVNDYEETIIIVEESAADPDDDIAIKYLNCSPSYQLLLDLDLDIDENFRSPSPGESESSVNYYPNCARDADISIYSPSSKTRTQSALRNQLRDHSLESFAYSPISVRYPSSSLKNSSALSDSLSSPNYSPNCSRHKHVFTRSQTSKHASPARRIDTVSSSSPSSLGNYGNRSRSESLRNPPSSSSPSGIYSLPVLSRSSRTLDSPSCDTVYSRRPWAPARHDSPDTRHFAETNPRFNFHGTMANHDLSTPQNSICNSASTLGSSNLPRREGTTPPISVSPSESTVSSTAGPREGLLELRTGIEGATNHASKYTSKRDLNVSSSGNTRSSPSRTPPHRRSPNKNHDTSRTSPHPSPSPKLYTTNPKSTKSRSSSARNGRAVSAPDSSSAPSRSHRRSNRLQEHNDSPQPLLRQSVRNSNGKLATRQGKAEYTKPISAPAEHLPDQNQDFPLSLAMPGLRRRVNKPAGKSTGENPPSFCHRLCLTDPGPSNNEPASSCGSSAPVTRSRKRPSNEASEGGRPTKRQARSS